MPDPLSLARGNCGLVRLGVFEADLDACELRKQGRRIRLQGPARSGPRQLVPWLYREFRMESVQMIQKIWRPRPDMNPCYRRERAMPNRIT